MPINSSLKVAFSALDDELRHQQMTQTQQIKAIWIHFQGNSANDLADEKVNSNVPSVVT